MIPLLFWLTNFQFVIGAFGAFAFFSAAWLNVDSWAIRREARTGFRALGFIFLAIWSGLHGIGTTGTTIEIVNASILLVGTILLLLSFIFDKLPLQPKTLAKLQRQQRNIVSKDEEIKAKKITPPTKEITAPTKLEKPLLANKYGAVIKTAKPQETPSKVSTKISSSAFLRLPKRKRSGATALLNGVIGFIIFSLIGWGFYAIYQNWFSAEEKQDIQLEESSFIEMNLTTPTPEAESVKEEEETEIEASPAAKKPTVTVKETETGYLNLRGGAGIIHDIITTISPGDTLELLDENKEWYELQIDENTTGWVSSRYVTKDE